MVFGELPSFKELKNTLNAILEFIKEWETNYRKY